MATPDDESRDAVCPDCKWVKAPACLCDYRAVDAARAVPKPPTRREQLDELSRMAQEDDGEYR